MTYVRDPYDTDEPPCFCGTRAPGPVLTTAEFCPACGDPEKRICPDCYGSGHDGTVSRNDCPVCNGHGTVLCMPAKESPQTPPDTAATAGEE